MTSRFSAPVTDFLEVFNLSDAAIEYEENVHSYVNEELGLPFLPRLSNQLQAPSAFVLEWISFHLGV